MSVPEIPRLNAWVITTPLGDATRVVAERNPYYWKVDPDASQLPYLYRVVYEVISDPEVLLLKASNGEIDMQDRHLGDPRNKPALARSREQHLDRAGYTERDGDGLRLGPDGERISFTVEVAATSTEGIDALELIRGYWRDVGVDAQVRAEDRSLFVERLEANDPEFTVWSGDGGANYELLLFPANYLPISVQYSKFGPGWALWTTSGGSQAEEPPEVVREQLELYKRVQASFGKEEQTRWMKEVSNIAKEQFYCMGMSLTVPGFGVVKNDFHNVPESMPWSGVYPAPAPTNPEQYFKEVG